MVFTTIHKFTEAHGEISERANVVVMADEAHRSQYGFVDGGAQVDARCAAERDVRRLHRHAADRDDRSTRHVFGEYADVYDIRQAVEDGATVPIYYESRIVKLTIDEAGAQGGRGGDRAGRQRPARAGTEAPENIRVPLEALVGAPERIERVAAFIVEHWEKRRAAMEGKAMVVTMSRDIAARLYEEIATLRPDVARSRTTTRA